MSELYSTNRPYSPPPTNVQVENDYTGIDRGLFLSRDLEPKYLRVISAEWTSHGPSGSPGLLRFKIGRYTEKPITDDDYNQFEFIKSRDNEEWFDVATSGPIHIPVLAEYWAKYIYFNYYLIQSQIDSIYEHQALIEDIVATGTSFTQSVAPSIKSVTNKATYSVAHGKPLMLTEFTSKLTPVTGMARDIDLTEQVPVSQKWDPVVYMFKNM